MQMSTFIQYTVLGNNSVFYTIYSWQTMTEMCIISFTVRFVPSVNEYFTESVRMHVRMEFTNLGRAVWLAFDKLLINNYKWSSHF